MNGDSDSQKKHILHLTFNMGIGGTEQVIRQLVLNLPQDHFENHVLCIDGKIGEIGVQLQKNGVEVCSLQRKPGFDWSLVRDIRLKIKQQKITVLHCHQYTPWVYGVLASLGTGARVVFTEHGRFYPDRYRYKAILANPVLAMMTDSIVAISSATRDALSRYEFIPRTKIRVVYNGIRKLTRDTEVSENIRRTLNIPRDAYVMGTVARLDPVKNQTMMLEAFSHVLARHPGCWLLIVGDGPDRGLLERKATELNIKERVKFTGFIDAPADYLATMDLFLLSSNTEGTSMTLLEAMSLGIPSVVTNVGGNPEVVSDCQTGLVCNKDSAPDFAKAINAIYESGKLSQSLSRESYLVFEKKFSVNKMIDTYSSIYLTNANDGAEYK